MICSFFCWSTEVLEECMGLISMGRWIFTSVTTHAHTITDVPINTPYAESIDLRCQNRELQATYEKYLISFP